MFHASRKKFSKQTRNKTVGLFIASSVPSQRGQYGVPRNAFQAVSHRYPYVRRFRSTPKRGIGSLPNRRIAKITTTVIKTVNRAETRSLASNVATKFMRGGRMIPYSASKLKSILGRRI